MTKSQVFLCYCFFAIISNSSGCGGGGGGGVSYLV